MNLQRLENFLKAAARLNEAVENYAKDTKNSFSRDALIQRFEFTFELAWKCLGEYLAAQGILLELKAPRPILKAAFSAGYIDGEQLWLEILQSRNLMSHIYDEATADQIARDITLKYIAAIDALALCFTKSTST